MKKPEPLFKEKVQIELALITGVWSFKTNMVAFGGIPDFIMCVRGHFVAWELKNNEFESPDGRQGWILRKIRKAGGKARTVHPGNVKRHLAEVRRLAK